MGTKNESEQNETDPDGGIEGKAGGKDAQMLKMETSEKNQMPNTVVAIITFLR